MFGKFKKPLLNTTIEVLCQNTGKTYHIHVSTAQYSRTCRNCGRETWVIHLGAGKGNVSVTYIDANGVSRELTKVTPGEQGALATVSAEGGTFVLVSQEDV